MPLVRFPKADFTAADTLRVPVEVYNAMNGDISPIRAAYYITNEQQQVLAGGEISKKGIPLGKHVELGPETRPHRHSRQQDRKPLGVHIPGEHTPRA